MPLRRSMVRVADLPRRQRRLRSPRHTFRLQQRPFVITPFLIAPVIPGETMKNLTLQARCQVRSISDWMAGWWLEYYIFYVKHRDLVERDAYVQMALDPSWNPAATAEAGDITTSYASQGGQGFVQKCLTRVVDEYFRDQDESIATVAGQYGASARTPKAHIDMPGWMDSMLAAVDLASEDVELLDISSLTTYEGGDDKLTVGELERAHQQWELLRAGNLTNQTYDEFLATYGIKPAAIELHRPELLRYVRDWKYPTIGNVQPTIGTGGAASVGKVLGQLDWNISERADKDRRFNEPGFIFGVSVLRPKTYFKGQTGAMSSWLDNVKYWMPPVLNDDPNSSVKVFADSAGGGPFGAALSGAFAVDMKDLFMHGDQFINFDRSADTQSSLMALPGLDGQRRYPIDADIEALFVTAGSQDAFNGGYVDGVVSLQIASVLEDTSDTSSGSVI